jgi:hypothetical protein
VATRWQRSGGSLALTAVVPVGCRADIHLPRVGDGSSLREGGHTLEPGFSGGGISEVTAPHGEFVVVVSGGRFAFEVAENG